MTENIELQNVEAFRKKLSIKETMPKKEWPMEIKINNNVYKVVWNKEMNVWESLALGDERYSKFVSKFTNSLSDYNVKMAYACVPYEQIIHIPEDTINDKLLKMQFFGDVLSLESDTFRLILNPFMNGIMIYGLFINRKFRNKGIGTELINKLYDLSEELDVPLYLTPYPDDDIEDTSKIWEKVNRLRNWYTKLGFGPIFNNQLVYSNYEDDDVLDFINNHKIKFG